MITLAMDTAYKMLTVGIYQDNKLMLGYSQQEFKKQSETIFPVIEVLLAECGLTYQQIDRIVITQGPGSYTGIRIAMTIAKVLATTLQKPLFTVSTMELYAGKEKQANVFLDARGQRVYAAHVEEGKTTWLGILGLDQIEEFLQTHPGITLGDTDLFGQEVAEVDFLQNFGALFDVMQPVEDPHHLVPLYLKESQAYKG